MKSGAKREWFLFISLFSREREIEVRKKILRERNLFVHVRHFKADFFIFLVKKFCYDFVLTLG